jgi:hypothetical protein
METLKEGYAAAAAGRIYRDHLSLAHPKAIAECSHFDEAKEAIKR